MPSRRTKRARKHIALRELLAAALSQLLPQAERDALREAKAPAKHIIKLFTPDHVHLYALGGIDRWHNLTMTRRGPELKAKDSRDTSIVAKVDRLIESAHERGARIAGKLYGAPTPEPRRRKRTIPSRPFPKGQRKLQSRNSFQRRQP